MNKSATLNLNDAQLETLLAADNGNHRGGGNNGNGQGNTTSFDGEEVIYTTQACGEEPNSGC